jgi:predicted P-loop ATPase
MAEYLHLPKSRQDTLKDAGGFVGGTLAGSRRKANAVTGRDVITLDLDNIQPGGTADVLRRVDALGCAYCVYSTRKHAEAKPRLRVLVPLNRTATADEYEPLTRKLGAVIGIELCDPTTFEASRLMYWPSCCADGVYIYRYGDKPFLDADGLLATYTDWRNVAEWPEVPGAQQAREKRAAKQGDPVAKNGVVGAFCKTYNVLQAIDVFLPEVYAPCDDAPGRYTYTCGSTTGGAIVYDNGGFLYSHHATDPVGGQLVNAFDLVRLHRFGDKDDDAKPDTPTNKLPSYKAMCELAVSDAAVATLLNQERYEKATKQDFAEAPHDPNWMAKLTLSATTGVPAKNIVNVRVVLEHDPLLKGRIRKDIFAEHIIGTAPLPWRKDETGDFRWTDDDDRNLREHLEKILGFRSREIIEDALHNHATAHGFNPLIVYLCSVEWDGIHRLDTLYIDYLGAEDCEYTRVVTRKGMVAAVARAMNPGCKFDTMTVINGRQGIYKSTLFAKLGGKWFSDSLRTFEGKEAAEMLQGLWILEIAELAAYGKSDIKAVKQFLSKSKDHYRAAYARKTEEHQRKCVFFGTTNEHDYLNDPTGNRRFWPVEAEFQKPAKSVIDDLTEYEIGQIWAEAVMRWRLGETLFLDDELEKEAEKRRNMHLDRDPLQGQIEEFLDKAIPEDWDAWSLERRQIYWGGRMEGNTIKLVRRHKICALEIWRECLFERRLMTKADSNRINSVLQTIPGWERVSTIRFGGAYGRQRGFRKCVNNGDKIVNDSPKIVNDSPKIVNIQKKEFVNNVINGATKN